MVLCRGAILIFLIWGKLIKSAKMVRDIISQSRRRGFFFMKAYFPHRLKA